MANEPDESFTHQIDDLILDILNDAARPAGFDSPAGLVPRAKPGAPLLERVLIAEVLAGSLADALAPALAAAIAPRILHLMEGGESSESQPKRPPARAGARKADSK
ncbi:hypothetical protein [Dactylosporangium sp. CA-139066]|uniref:hypothetical protein n=1 Tax=Dactylosporangium sp. CA-139066 TaxID=3239930 RepID=UPI003D94E651